MLKATPNGGRRRAGSRRRTSASVRATGYDAPRHCGCRPVSTSRPACATPRRGIPPRASARRASPHGVIIGPPAHPEQALSHEQVARVLHRPEHLGDRFHDQPLVLAGDAVDHDVAPPVDRGSHFEMRVFRVELVDQPGSRQRAEHRLADLAQRAFERAVAPEQARRAVQPRQSRHRRGGRDGNQQSRRAHRCRAAATRPRSHHWRARSTRAPAAYRGARAPAARGSAPPSRAHAPAAPHRRASAPTWRRSPGGRRRSRMSVR